MIKARAGVTPPGHLDGDCPAPRKDSVSGKKTDCKWLCSRSV